MKYKTSGVCSRSIDFDVVDNKVTNVAFEGGCSGNTQGVAALVEGMDIDEAIRRMEGIRCGFKSTSCPDQLATALKQYKALFYLILQFRRLETEQKFHRSYFSFHP